VFSSFSVLFVSLSKIKISEHFSFCAIFYRKKRRKKTFGHNRGDGFQSLNEGVLQRSPGVRKIPLLT